MPCNVAGHGGRACAVDRQGLERRCRYGARGALALERLSRAEDGRIAYRMTGSWMKSPRRPWRTSGASSCWCAAMMPR
nr:transposase [Myxococcus xanthus]